MPNALNKFWIRRLYSLSGIFFLAAYLISFLIPYSSILASEDSFNKTVSFFAHIPFWNIFEFVFLFTPIVFCTVVFLTILSSSQFNVFYYPYYKNWMFSLERVCNLILIPFIGYHLYVSKFLFLFTNQYADYSYMKKIIDPIGIKSFYILGIICLSIYIGIALSRMLFIWGITATRKSRDWTSIVMWVVSIVIAAWGLTIIFAF